MAIKLHFTSDKYDVFETRGNVKGTREAFNHRNDRYIFEKLAQKYPNDKDIIQFFVSNFAYSKDTAIYANGEAAESYTEWLRKKQSITKVFIDDLTNIMNYSELNKLHKPNMFTTVDGEPPILLNLFLSGKVNIETLCIINEIEPFLDKWKSDTMIQIILGDKLTRIKKLTGFVKYDRIKLSKVFEHFLTELN